MLNFFLRKRTLFVSILTNFYNILYLNRNFLLLATFAVFAKIDFSICYIGQISKIRKNDILNFFVRKHTSLLSILNHYYEGLYGFTIFLLLATFATFAKIEFHPIFTYTKSQKPSKATSWIYLWDNIHHLSSFWKCFYRIPFGFRIFLLLATFAILVKIEFLPIFTYGKSQERSKLITWFYLWDNIHCLSPFWHIFTTFCM